jgi:predicted neutral ceramidase superfamily lipid hydrolase
VNPFSVMLAFVVFVVTLGVCLQARETVKFWLVGAYSLAFLTTWLVLVKMLGRPVTDSLLMNEPNKMALTIAMFYGAVSALLLAYPLRWFAGR